MTAAKTRVVSLFHSGIKLEIRFGLTFANLQLSLFPCFFPIQPMPCSAFLIFLSLSFSLYLTFSCFLSCWQCRYPSLASHWTASSLIAHKNDCTFFPHVNRWLHRYSLPDRSTKLISLLFFFHILLLRKFSLGVSATNFYAFVIRFALLSILK